MLQHFISVARRTNYSLYKSSDLGTDSSIAKLPRKKRRLAAPQNRQWYSVNTGIKFTPENIALQQCKNPENRECNRLQKQKVRFHLVTRDAIHSSSENLYINLHKIRINILFMILIIFEIIFIDTQL